MAAEISGERTRMEEGAAVASRGRSTAIAPGSYLRRRLWAQGLLVALFLGSVVTGHLVVGMLAAFGVAVNSALLLSQLRAG